MKETKYAGTQTEKNLMAAFAGESEARNKYTYFASKAKKEGFEQIAALFLKTADNEKEHAKLWFKELNGIGDTAENLLSAAEGENYEWTDMYDGLSPEGRHAGAVRRCCRYGIGQPAGPGLRPCGRSGGGALHQAQCCWCRERRFLRQYGACGGGLRHPLR